MSSYHLDGNATQREEGGTNAVPGARCALAGDRGSATNLARGYGPRFG